MNKKLFIFGLISILCLCSAYALDNVTYSIKFANKLKNCEQYEDTINSEYNGRTFTTVQKIIGKRGEACYYQETMSSGSEKYRLDCMFSQLQTEEL